MWPPYYSPNAKSFIKKQKSTASGNVILDPDEMTIKAFPDPLPTLTIPPDLVDKLEAPLTQAETALAISSMQCVK